VGNYRKKQNYTLILEKKSVVAYDEAVDITEKIIELFDKNKK
jgi:Skp family chaperone for outer membrane proteins